MAERVLTFARREDLLIALAAAYVLFRVIGFLEAEPGVFNDTRSYEDPLG